MAGIFGVMCGHCAEGRMPLQIRTLCLSPDGGLLLAIDVDGRSLLINKRRRVLLHHFSFKGPVQVARFSPDGQYIACAVGKVLQVHLVLNPPHPFVSINRCTCRGQARQFPP